MADATKAGLGHLYGPIIYCGTPAVVTMLAIPVTDRGTASGSHRGLLVDERWSGRISGV